MIRKRFNKQDKIICSNLFLYFGIIIIGLVFSPNKVLFAQTTFKDEQNRYIRVRQARENREEQIDSLFKSINITYPPRGILIIAFKDERILELWTKQESLETYILVKRFDLTAFSGTLGPKRKRGDLQIPEGFYHITHFNPVSTFHLSLEINYPNESDRILGERGNLGDDIFIHGSMVTIGCMPIGDAAIEELYLICVDVKSQNNSVIPVYIFPSHMDNISMIRLKQVAGQDTTLFSFWENLKKGYDKFYTTNKKLEFRVAATGNYIFSNQNPNHAKDYSWQLHYDKKNTLINRIEVPEGYERIPVAVKSFADWLRNLQLKEGNPPVYLYDGTKKSYQDGHYAVIDIDIGPKNLQQCADAIIRLYAEHLYTKKDFEKIEFKITNGDLVKFRKWISGYRPVVSNGRVIWHRTAISDSSYKTFRNYLDFVFMYAGTYSLSQQLRKKNNINDITIGDIFIQGGFPGHAVLVVDIAVHTQSQEKIFLLGQSYMPAQDIHILKNLKELILSPWYKVNFGDTLYIPQWNFTPPESCLRSF